MDVLADVSLVRLSGPTITSLGGGYNQWDAVFQITNISSNPLPLYWYWVSAQPVDPATGSLVNMTWNNSGQRWEYTSTMVGLMTAETITPATYIQLSQTDVGALTGVNSSDSLPAYYLGVVAPGNSAIFTWDRKLTNNISTYFNSVTVLTPTVPEPSSLLLMGGGVLASLGVMRRRISR
jgi:hypothetical protein